MKIDKIRLDLNLQDTDIQPNIIVASDKRNIINVGLGVVATEEQMNHALEEMKKKKTKQPGAP